MNLKPKPQKSILFLSIVAFGCVAASNIPPQKFTYSMSDYKDAGGRKIDADTAINSPGVYAWKLFLNINRPGYSSTDKRRGNAIPNREIGDDGPTIWEGWKHPKEVYREGGKPPDKFSQPTPPDFERRELQKGLVLLASSKGFDIGKLRFDSFSAKNLVSRPELRQLLVDANISLSSEEEKAFSETRINKSAFTFIRDSNLYSKKGLIKFWTDQKPIEFERAGIEIKARWKYLGADTQESKWKDRYHTLKIDKELYGLTSLHIITKDVPNWFWCTFEHFDSKEPNLSPDQKVPDIDPQTNKEFVRIKGSRGPIPKVIKNTKWQYYRLRGTQTAFNNGFGVPETLDNTQLEQVTTFPSSCMSCHARSSIGPLGLRYMYLDQPFPDTGMKPIRDSAPIFTGPTGPPEEGLFIDPTNKKRFIQADFVWSIFRAQ